MGAILAFWAVTLAAGVVAFPIVAPLLRRLPDRGAGMALALGVALLGYLYFMLRLLGVLELGRGGALLAIAVLALVSAAIAGRDRKRAAMAMAFGGERDAGAQDDHVRARDGADAAVGKAIDPWDDGTVAEPQQQFRPQLHGSGATPDDANDVARALGSERHEIGEADAAVSRFELGFQDERAAAIGAGGAHRRFERLDQPAAILLRVAEHAAGRDLSHRFVAREGFCLVRHDDDGPAGRKGRICGFCGVRQQCGARENHDGPRVQPQQLQGVSHANFRESR